jgi:hypothetical protein
MATSGTSVFNLDFAEIAEEAFERAGLELRSGYDMRTARRSLNLICAEWANLGLNLWTIGTGTITLTPGQGTYTTSDGVPADMIDMIEHVVRTNNSGVNTDISLNRISVSDYANIPTKATQGRPLQIYVNRQIQPTITLWPVPDSSTPYTLVYWYLRRIQDTGASAANNADIPVRFLPALIAGLAYQIALKRPEASDRIQMLKSIYEEQFQVAATEDRDRAPDRFIPFISYGNY